MEDKKFDEIMRGALKIDVDEKDILFNRETGVKKSMRISRIVKPAIAVAACAALVLGVSRIPSMKTIENAVSASETSGVVEAVANSFTVKVQAAETTKTLKKEKGTPVLKSTNADFSCWGGDPDDYSVDYVESFPVICDGKNIEKITYTINKGAFQIFTPKGSGFILDGEKYKGDLNVGAITPKGYDEEDEDGRIGVNFDEGYYTSYTVSADNQSAEDVRVSICNETKLPKKIYNIMWASDKKIEDFKKGIEKAYGDLKIKCEVTYADGSTDSVDIAVGVEVMTPEEAGDPNYDPEKNDKTVYTVYSIA